jgi:hypothetical protein
MFSFFRPRKKSRSSRKTSLSNKFAYKKLAARSLSFEPLEVRTLLSVCYWDGGSEVDSNWTTPANWEGDTAPSSGDSLVFRGSQRTSTQNNFSAGTSFYSIEFAESNFSLAGNYTGSMKLDHDFRVKVV